MGWRPADPVQVTAFAAWRPLLLAAREARREGVPWALDPLDFDLIGHVERKVGPPVAVFAHTRGDGHVCVDETGRSFGVTVDRAGRYRCKQIDIRVAVWRAGVPQLDEDDPYIESPSVNLSPPRETRPAATRRARHLRIVRPKES